MTVVPLLSALCRGSVVVRRRLPRRAVFALALASLALLALPANAEAHAELESTTPTNGQVLAAAPGAVDLHFGEAVEIALGSVQVVDAGGSRVDVGNAHHPGGRGSDVEVVLRPSLPKGTYLVRWRVVSSDSHPVSGSFVFSVGAATVAPQATASDGDPIVGFALGVMRFLDFAGLALLVGGSLFLVWCWPAGAGDARARGILSAGWWAAVVGTVGGLLLEGPYGAGLGLSSVLDPATVHGAAATRFGHAQLARLGLLLAAASVLFAAGPRLRGERRLPVPLVLVGAFIGIGLLATIAISGHAADGSDAWLAVPIDVAHLVAMAAWLGGLATLGACLLFRRRVSAADLRAAVPRFSPLAASCVAALIVTGVYAAWRDLGGWGPLTGTEQGQLLLVKLAVVAVLLVAAMFSRRWVTVRIRAGTVQRWGEAHRMKWSILVESTLAVVVLAVTAALVAVPPGKNDWRPASSFDLAAGPVRLQLSAVPLGPDRIDLHVYTFTEAGAPSQVPELTATADQPSRSIAGLPVRFANAGPGHFLANGLTLPASGEWTLAFHVRTTDIDEYTATAHLTVR